jgi:hypothetical protein
MTRPALVRYEQTGADRLGCRQQPRLIGRSRRRRRDPRSTEDETARSAPEHLRVCPGRRRAARDVEAHQIGSGEDVADGLRVPRGLLGLGDLPVRALARGGDLLIGQLRRGFCLLLRRGDFAAASVRLASTRRCSPTARTLAPTTASARIANATDHIWRWRSLRPETAATSSRPTSTACSSDSTRSASSAAASGNSRRVLGPASRS